MSGNKYRLSPETYNRDHDRWIDRGAIHEVLVGEKSKEIIDVTAKEKPLRLEVNAIHEARRRRILV